jgi:hypothetical protein
VAARCPAEPDQAGQDHHKNKIKKKQKGTRSKPDTNFSSSKKIQQQGEQLRTSSNFCSYHPSKNKGGSRITLSLA